LVVGSRTLVARGLVIEIIQLLRKSGVEAVELASISREPEVTDVDQATSQLRADVAQGDFVLAIGGGAAIDLGKAAAALATQRDAGSVLDYLEGVGRGLALSEPPLPVLALPTTAGTGSEATKNAVISSTDPPFKKSLRADAMIPRAVLVDPELTVSCPREVTAHSGMDAITQLIESYISCRAQPVPQALALDGLSRAAPAIAEAVCELTSRRAREAMAHAALLSGMALANSGLGMAHGVAAALGVHARVPHGLACAVMLPAALDANRSVSAAHYAEMELAIHGVNGASGGVDELANAFVRRITSLAHEIGIPRRLSEIGVRQDQLPDIVRDSRGNSMNGNPRPIDDHELFALLEKMI
jgi:alcohol dehydrogenase class IV